MTKEEFKEKVKIKKWEFDNWLTNKTYQAKVFWEENRDYIVVLAPIVLASGERVIRSVSRNKRLAEERDLKDRYIYDRSFGCYYELKRKPTQSEYLEIDRRKRNGESMGSILNSMRLIK